MKDLLSISRSHGARLALAATLVAGGLVAAPHFAAHAAPVASPKPDWRGAEVAGGLVAAPHFAAHAAPVASPKPDWRGADAGNTGVQTTTGPATRPSQTFNAKTGFGRTGGVELDAAGNVVFTLGGGRVYSYTPAGTLNWVFPAAGTTGAYGSDVNASPSNPTLSTDGATYVGNDNGNLYQINTSTGAGQVIFADAANGALQYTPKIGPDNSLYIGAADGTFYRLTPPALGAGAGVQATPVYTFTATGSTQANGVYAGTTSSAPFKFYGEAALDSAGNAYLASTDNNPAAAGQLGTLYAVSPSGGLNWKASLRGAVSGAVIYATNPLTPSQPLVVVADKFPEIAAFDAATGQQVWDYVPQNSVGALISSPLLYNGTVYAVNNSDSVYALNVATGQPLSTFGTNGVLPFSSGSFSSPVVDAGGTLFLNGNTGGLYALNPTTGAQLYLIPPGTASSPGSSTGTSGNTGPGYMSPAIATDGTLYLGGNGALVRGFQAAAAPADQTSTAVAGGTATANANVNNTATAAAQTSTAVANQTVAASQTGMAQTAAATAASLQTATALAGQTATAAAGQTSTALADSNNATQTAFAGTAAATTTALAFQVATATAAAGQTATAAAAAGQTAAPGQTATSLAGQTATAAAAQTAAPGQTATAAAVAMVTARAGQTATAVAAQTATSGAGQTATAAAQQTSTAASLQTATAQAGQTQTAYALQTATIVAQTPTAIPGPASSWSKFRRDLHNDGDITATLDLSSPPGQAWFDRLPSTDRYPTAMYTSPAIGPDGVVYQVDPHGALWALNPKDGSTRWTSARVLGSLSNAPQLGRDFGSSPAVAADGSIYVGSQAGGIYRFDPTNGNNARFFAGGQYQGGSVVIGPGGVVYGGSIDGTVYAINPDGSQKYAATPQCPAGYKVFVQSTPAIDKNGDLYIGFGCSGSATIPRGGVLALDATGRQRWQYSYSSDGVNGGSVNAAVTLSPDEATLYVEDATQGNVYAINTSDGSQKWVNNSFSVSPGDSLALSPDGSLIYLATFTTNSAAANPSVPNGSALYALRATDGSILQSQTQVDIYTSPAVDAAGQVIVAKSSGHIAAYSPGLGSQLFDYPIQGQGVIIWGGPTIGNDGSIYVTNRSQYLIALRAGVALQPTPTPYPPQIAYPALTPPTDTPVATIAVTTTPVTTAATPTPTGTITTTATVTNTGVITGANTTNVKGNGFTLQFTGGTFKVGDQIHIRVETTPDARVSYDPVTVQYVYPSAPRATTPGRKAGGSKKGSSASGVKGSAKPGASHPTPPKKKTAPTKTKGYTSGGLAPLVAHADAILSTAALAAPVAKATPRPSGKGKPTAKGRPGRTTTAKGKPGAKGRPGATSTAKGKPSAKGAGKKPTASPCPIQINDSRTLRYTRTADGHGVDAYCMLIAATPARAIGLRVTLTVRIATGKTALPATTFPPFLVQLPRLSTRPGKSNPTTRPRTRLVLPAVIDVSPLHGTVSTGQTETIRLFTARGAVVTYRVSYQGSQIRVVTRVADRNGNDAFSFRVAYLPLRSVGTVKASVSVSAIQRVGRTMRHARSAVVSFIVTRPDVVVQLRAVRVGVEVGAVRVNGVQTIDTVSARGAKLAYTVTYPNGVTARYAGSADGSGHARLRFHVQYAPRRSARVLAIVTVVATQGGARASVRTRFYIQG